jgi:hypothetical protein
MPGAFIICKKGSYYRAFHYNAAKLQGGIFISIPQPFIHIAIFIIFKDNTFSESCRLSVIYNNTPFKNK